MKPMETPERADRRSKRTRHSLSQALMSLMLEKPYHTITVQDIVDRANVGRSTFYAHYQTKDDLLPTEFAWLIEKFTEDVESLPDAGQPVFPSLTLFHHVKEMYPLYKAVVRQNSLDVIAKTFQVVISRSVEKQLHAMLASQQKSSPHAHITADYVANAFLTVLQWWLANNMRESPEQVDELFRELVMPGVQTVLNVELR